MIVCDHKNTLNNESLFLYFVLLQLKPTGATKRETPQNQPTQTNKSS